MARVLFIVGLAACGDAKGGGPQRSSLIFDSLMRQYEVDVMIVGTGVADIHREQFAGAGRIIEALHASPGDALPLGPFQSLVPPGIRDKIAMAAMPRRKAYEPDDKLKEAVKDFDYHAYDLIVGRHLRPAVQVGAFGRNTTVPVLIDIDDRDDVFFLSRLQKDRFNPILDQLNRWHGHEAARVMARELPKSKHLWLVSDEDRDGLDHSSISILPNIPFSIPEASSPPDPASKSILFIGMAIHVPNHDGLVHFLKACWPGIIAAEPDASLRIIGRGWECLPASLTGQRGIDVVGFVDDITDEYQRAAFVIAPVYDGAGTKIKIIEALAHERAVVASEHAHRGYPVDLIRDCAISAKDDAAMIEGCTRLLRNPDEAAKRGTKGRDYALRGYTRAHFRNILLEDCERVLKDQDKTSGKP